METTQVVATPSIPRFVVQTEEIAFRQSEVEMESGKGA